MDGRLLVRRRASGQRIADALCLFDEAEFCQAAAVADDEQRRIVVAVFEVVQIEGLVENEPLTAESVADREFRVDALLHTPAPVAEMEQQTVPVGVPLDGDEGALGYLVGAVRRRRDAVAALRRRHVAVVGHKGLPVRKTGKPRQYVEGAFADVLVAVDIAPYPFEGADADGLLQPPLDASRKECKIGRSADPMVGSLLDK